MTLMVAKTLDLPGIPEPIDDEPKPDDKPDVPEQVNEQTTHIAVDGIDSELLTDAEVDVIEKKVADVLMLDLGKPITGVRVIRGDTGVVEFEIDNAELDN